MSVCHGHLGNHTLTRRGEQTRHTKKTPHLECVDLLVAHIEQLVRHARGNVRPQKCGVTPTAAGSQRILLPANIGLRAAVPLMPREDLLRSYQASQHKTSRRPPCELCSLDDSLKLKALTEKHTTLLLTSETMVCTAPSAGFSG